MVPAIINQRIADLEKRSEENGCHVDQLKEDILSGLVDQDEVSARLDRVREVHQKLRKELESLARQTGIRRIPLAS